MLRHNTYTYLYDAQLVLMGATADNPHFTYAPLVSAFQNLLGIKIDSANSNLRCLMAFVAQVGMPERAVYVAEKSGNPDLYLNVQIQGEKVRRRRRGTRPPCALFMSPLTHYFIYLGPLTERRFMA